MYKTEVYNFKQSKKLIFVYFKFARFEEVNILKK